LNSQILSLSNKNSNFVDFAKAKKLTHSYDLKIGNTLKNHKN